MPHSLSTHQKMRFESLQSNEMKQKQKNQK